MEGVPTIESLAVPETRHIAELERVAAAVALDAARFVVDHRPQDLQAVTKSSRTDVVTVMDQAAQERILAALAQARPDDAVLGEEAGGSSGISGITWVVDPIDGTTNYLYGLPPYAVSVAAVVGDPRTGGGWRPVAGAVVDAACGTSYQAGLGLGARRIDAHGAVTPLKAAPAPDLGTALVATGFGYRAPRRAAQARVLLDLLPQVRDIRRLGSAAIDLCHLAAGQVDAYYETGLNPWDMAAGWLVCTESGIVVGGLGGPEDLVPAEELLWACPQGLVTAYGGLVAGLTVRHKVPQS